VQDDQGAYSVEIYTISIYSGFVPYNITYKPDTTLEIDEDLSITFPVDRYDEDYFGGNEGQTEVNLTVSDIVEIIGGQLGFCPPPDYICQPFTEASTDIPSGSLITYIADPNLYAETGAITFSLTLTPATTGAPAITVPYVINVLPVNDNPVLFPLFNTTASGQPNVCLEDTYKIIEFEATDIDDLTSVLVGDVEVLPGEAFGNWYVCDDSPNGVNTHGDCMRGAELTAGTFVPIFHDQDKATFRILFIPWPNVYGEANALITVLDDSSAPSQSEILVITVLPVNDAPDFIQYGRVPGKVANSSQDKWFIQSEVFDVDFYFDYRLNVTYTLRKANGAGGNGGNVDTSSPSAFAPAKRSLEQNGNVVDPDRRGWFVLPQTSGAGDPPPCVVSDDGLSITCEELIEVLNPWLLNGIDLVFDSSVSGQVEVELNVNDLGNIDYRDPPPPLNTSRWIREQIAAASLGAATKPANNNIALIAAPIAGLLAGALLAGLIFAIRKNKQKEAVENYFDRFAIGMEGVSNASPLYEGATIGGESPIYKGS